MQGKEIPFIEPGEEEEIEVEKNPTYEKTKIEQQENIHEKHLGWFNLSSSVNSHGFLQKSFGQTFKHLVWKLYVQWQWL